MSGPAVPASPVPNYSEVLNHLTEPLGGRPAFRKISCEVAYPLYGAQVLLVKE